MLFGAEWVAGRFWQRIILTFEVLKGNYSTIVLLMYLKAAAMELTFLLEVVFI